MQILDIKLQDYRNIEWAELSLTGPRHFFLGPNGQGKTNMLEAIHLISSLKSFRQADTQALIRNKCHQAIVSLTINHPQWDSCPILLTLNTKGKTLLINEKKVTKFSEWVGLCPSVVICSDDLLLLRGSPGGRRRFVDSLLASVDPTYLKSLKKYHALLAERNALLKQVKPSPTLLSSFEKLLATEGILIIQKRTQAFTQLTEIFTPLYLQLSQKDEAPSIAYHPNINCNNENNLLQAWYAARKKDVILKTTSTGPHRDDFVFELKANKARHFASEGQQRSLVIALKLAQIQYIERQTHHKPIVLADDVLGQLDPDRQTRFWEVIDSQYQVLATGTVPPSNNQEWQIWDVNHGGYEVQKSALKTY